MHRTAVQLMLIYIYMQVMRLASVTHVRDGRSRCMHGQARHSFFMSLSSTLGAVGQGETLICQPVSASRLLRLQSECMLGHERMQHSDLPHTALILVTDMMLCLHDAVLAFCPCSLV
jgi:hypothetical protein